VGTNNDSSLIDQALVKTYRDDFTAQPLTVRSILEPLHVLKVPKSAAHAYDKLTERSQVHSGETKDTGAAATAIVKKSSTIIGLLHTF